jgi:hypothetical protein
MGVCIWWYILQNYNYKLHFQNLFIYHIPHVFIRRFILVEVHSNIYTCTLWANLGFNPMPNAQVCVYLTVHITKLHLQATFPKPFYIPRSACIHRALAAESLDVCTACDPWDSNIQLTMVKDWRWQIYPQRCSVSDLDSCWLSYTIFIKYYDQGRPKRKKLYHGI